MRGRPVSTHLAIIERAGRNASADFLGEGIIEVQEIHGGTGAVGAYLAELYAEQKLIGSKLDDRP